MSELKLENHLKTTESQIWFNYYGIIFFRKTTECLISPDIVVFRAQAISESSRKRNRRKKLCFRENLGVTRPLSLKLKNNAISQLVAASYLRGTVPSL